MKRGSGRGVVGANLSALIAAMFAASSAQGRWWYDPSDLTTMWQDSLGTTPATAPGQGVADCSIGKLNDKSGGNNHQLQATSPKRTLLSARFNLLVGSAAMATQNVTTAAVSYTLRTTGSGTVTLSGTSTAGPLVGGGTLTFTPTAGTLTLTVTGSVLLADLRLTADTLLNAPAYQAVVDANTYDTAGFPWYLRTDGTDDAMGTAGNVLYGGSDKLTVFAAITKLTDVAVSALIESSANSTTTAGSFGVFAPVTGGVGNYQVRAGGSIPFGGVVNSPTTYNAPVTNVLMGMDDISADALSLAVAGVTVGSSAGDQGTGGFTDQLLYLFGRAGTSFYFNGRFFGGLGISEAMSAANQANCLAYYKQKAGLP